MHYPMHAPIRVPNSFPMCDPNLIYYYFEDVFAGFLDMGSWLHEWMCWIFNHSVVFYMQIYHWKWQGHREIYTPEDLERMLGELFEGETRIDQRRWVAQRRNIILNNIPMTITSQIWSPWSLKPSQRCLGCEALVNNSHICLFDNSTQQILEDNNQYHLPPIIEDWWRQMCRSSSLSCT